MSEHPESESRRGLLGLPTELVLEIFKYLRGLDHVRAGFVCHRLREFAKSFLFKSIILSFTPRSDQKYDWTKRTCCLYHESKTIRDSIRATYPAGSYEKGCKRGQTRIMNENGLASNVAREITEAVTSSAIYRLLKNAVTPVAVDVYCASEKDGTACGCFLRPISPLSSSLTRRIGYGLLERNTRYDLLARVEKLTITVSHDAADYPGLNAFYIFTNHCLPHLLKSLPRLKEFLVKLTVGFDLRCENILKIFFATVCALSTSGVAVSVDMEVLGSSWPDLGITVGMFGLHVFRLQLGMLNDSPEDVRRLEEEIARIITLSPNMQGLSLVNPGKYLSLDRIFNLVPIGGGEQDPVRIQELNVSSCQPPKWQSTLRRLPLLDKVTAGDRSAACQSADVWAAFKASSVRPTILRTRNVTGDLFDLLASYSRSDKKVETLQMYIDRDTAASVDQHVDRFWRQILPSLSNHLTRLTIAPAPNYFYYPQRSRSSGVDEADPVQAWSIRSCPPKLHFPVLQSAQVFVKHHEDRNWLDDVMHFVSLCPYLYILGIWISTDLRRRTDENETRVLSHVQPLASEPPRETGDLAVHELIMNLRLAFLGLGYGNREISVKRYHCRFVEKKDGKGRIPLEYTKMNLPWRDGLVPYYDDHTYNEWADMSKL